MIGLSIFANLSSSPLIRLVYKSMYKSVIPYNMIWFTATPIAIRTVIFMAIKKHKVTHRKSNLLCHLGLQSLAPYSLATSTLFLALLICYFSSSRSSDLQYTFSWACARNELRWYSCGDLYSVCHMIVYSLSYVCINNSLVFENWDHWLRFFSTLDVRQLKYT